MDVILAPDVFVNASVALGSPPEQVVRRLLSGETRQKTSRWILERVESMLHALPTFKEEAVLAQMETIRSLVDVVDETEIDDTDWLEGLRHAAKAAGIERVITDHPDFADKDVDDGLEFMSTDAWLIEQVTPPPPPVG